MGLLKGRESVSTSGGNFLELPRTFSASAAVLGLEVELYSSASASNSASTGTRAGTGTGTGTATSASASASTGTGTSTGASTSTSTITSASTSATIEQVDRGGLRTSITTLRSCLSEFYLSPPDRARRELPGTKRSVSSERRL